MKHYPPEFKAEAVALYRSRPGTTIKSVAGGRRRLPEHVNDALCHLPGAEPGRLLPQNCRPS